MVISRNTRATSAPGRIPPLVAVVLSAALLFCPRPAIAAPCMDEAFGAPTNCAANDFGVASIMITAIDDDGCSFLGDTFTFDAMLTVAGPMSNRYDVGFYVANDSIQARSGQCTVAVIPPGSSRADDGDACGDFDGEPYSVPISDVTVACVDSDRDAFFDLVVCATYSQNPGRDCSDPSQAVPGSASRCNCQRVMSDEPVPPCETNADCIDDGDPCTDEVCNAPQSGIGDSAGCSHEANSASCDDLSICRGPRYWSTRSGYEGGAPNVVQDVLDATAGLAVCGRWIDATDHAGSPFLEGLGLDSALQGLCVRAKSVEQRRLDRQLVATALNCAVSGRADCDAFVQEKVDVAFSACNDVCAGIDAGPDAPPIARCIAELACFNDGGEIVDGKCALGTCRSDPGLACGSSHGSCPDIEGRAQRCLKFPGNCRAQPLCNEGLGVCPMRTARSSRTACREAMTDDCTIDSCP